MGSEFEGDAERFRAAAVTRLNRILGLTSSDWKAVELPALGDFAVTLFLVGDLGRWSDQDKQALVKVIRSKAGTDERGYLLSMQKHQRLRAAMIRLGS
jgi:hypothetical protein